MYISLLTLLYPNTYQKTTEGGKHTVLTSTARRKYHIELLTAVSTYFFPDNWHHLRRDDSRHEVHRQQLNVHGTSSYNRSFLKPYLVIETLLLPSLPIFPLIHTIRLPSVRLTYMCGYKNSRF